MGFQYQPLQKNYVRLLEPSIVSQDILTFRITHQPLSTASYSALSYTWGDGAPTEQIYINGKLFRVRLNLWSCLFYLGAAARSQCVPWRYLWVDAICIDQNNTEERSAQVRLMDRIYRNAIEVSVWLGLPPIPDFLIQTVNQSHELVKTYENDGFDWRDSIQELANRPYWTRFWVIQEFLLGQDVNIHCGNQFVDWLHFKDIFGEATGVHDYLQEDVDYARSSSGSWAAWPLVTGRHPDKHPELPQSLYKLLLAHSKSQCGEPRDRVFALLGLVTSDERALLDRFFPDYKMAVDDVIVITLSHVKANAFGEPIDMRQLLSALAVESVDRQRRLLKRSEEFDYLDSQPSIADRFWLSDFGDSDSFDVSTWDEPLRTRTRSPTSRLVKHAFYLLGLVMLLAGTVGYYYPHVVKMVASFITRLIWKARELIE
jgi:hypothetical protein